MTSDEKTTDRVFCDEQRAAIRRIRETAGLGQGELAKLARVSPSKLSEFESGKRNFGLGSLERIVDALMAAVAERKAQLRNLTSLASLRFPSREAYAESEARKVTHFLNLLERTASGGFVLEYQGPGLVTCEEYRFESVDELLEFLDKCFATFERMILTSDLPREDE